MQADQEKHQVTLTFDSDITDQETIKKKLEEAGFSVQGVELAAGEEK